ncbi:hypothetical protein BDW59DRAFT_112415 [Aspergillus cavernicola]|uniref:Uncharacterized protein n=1 Tax=Aspergillus cavernicola TaxID=176166 RepID=A0ABR4I1X6_9EURO
MSRKTPHAAFVEEYDEDSHAILPDTRQVANVTAKRSKSDLRRSTREPFVEAASDSGYSSRTAATANSTQSAPSGRKSPGPLKVDTSLRRADLERVRSRNTKDRPRDRSARPTREDKMHAGPYSAGYPPAHAPRSPSRSQRHEQTYTRHYPSNYWDAEQGVYHATTPVEPRQREYRYHSSQASSAYDYPPSSPQTTRYPPATVVQVSRSSRPPGRTARSNSYHTNNRPVSFHGMVSPMNGMMYNQSPMSRYDHGPPPSSSAYANAPTYPPTPPSLYSQQSPSPYYGYPGATSPPEHQERSFSQAREHPRKRRPSLFEPPAIDYGTSEEEEEEEEEEDDEEVMEEEEPAPPPPPPGPPRQARQRLPSHSSHDRGEEDYYRSMPRPPLKHKAPPQIIQKRPELPRKSATTASVMSERRPSRSLDMGDLGEVLDGYGYRGSGRETVIPERNRSLRENRRPSTTYHDSSRSAARVAVENSTRRRQPTIYSDRPEYHYPVADELEEKQRGAEEYQASQTSKSGVAPVALTADALLTKAGSQRAASDSGSQKSRSASSRGSDARTQSGSGALTTTRQEEDNNIIMTMNGVTMSFTQESVGGKRISVRTGQTGAVELNIEGKRPKKYVAGGSEYTTASSASKKGDRSKSDRASRRSGRSVYNGGRY